MGAEAAGGRPGEVLLPDWGFRKGFPQDWRLKRCLKDVQAEGCVGKGPQLCETRQL